MKFGPQNFPVGTKFLLHEDSTRYARDLPPSGVFTATGIVQNGVNSYVVKTGRFTMKGSPDVEEGFNIEHIKEIVDRGHGPVKIDYGWYGLNTKKLAVEVERMEFTKNRRKGFYATGSIQTVLAYELSKLTGPEGMLISSSMFNEFKTQSWAKLERQEFYAVWHVNKKRLRKWLKANVNRFKKTRKSAFKEEQKLYEEDYKREMDALDKELDERYPQYVEPEGGSHYDADDYRPSPFENL